MTLEDNILDDDLDYSNALQELQFRAASFLLRLLASLLDMVFLWGVGVVLINGLGTVVGETEMGIQFLIVGLVYKPGTEHLYGATFGKLITRIRVINEQGEKIDLRTTAIRNSLYLIINSVILISSLFTFAYHWAPTSPDEVNTFSLGVLNTLNVIRSITAIILVVSCLFVAFRPNGRALHDSWAGTYVIRRSADGGGRISI